MKILATFFLTLLFIKPATATSAEGGARSGAATVTLQSFGATANNPQINSRRAFQQALAALASQGGGTLHIPRGDYYLDFPDIANDLDPNEASTRPVMAQSPLDKSKLIVIPTNVMIEGETDAAGSPVTRIHWKATSFPIFSLINSSHSGIKSISLVFDGTQPHFFTWRTEQYLAAMGINTKADPFYELSAVIYAYGAEGTLFENLTFASGAKHPDNEHTFAFGIVAKGKSPITQPGRDATLRLPMGSQIPSGGLSELASGNTFRSLRFSDFVMGILASGQYSPVFDNISGDNRGSWYRSFDPNHETGTSPTHIGPPGHLIYITGQNTFNLVKSPQFPQGHDEIHSVMRNQNLVIRNIKEGPHTYSNFNSLGTFALKFIEGGVIENVQSHHPSGLIVSMADAHHLTLQNLTWSTDQDICSDPDSARNCHHPAIALIPQAGAGENGFNDYITFKNVKLSSTRWASVIEVTSAHPPGPQNSHIDFEGLTIESTAKFHSGQTAPEGLITLQAVDSTLSNVTYTPILANISPQDKLNTAVVVRSGSSNVKVDVGIHNPVDHPDAYAQVRRTVVDEHQPGKESVGLNNRSVITSHEVK